MKKDVFNPQFWNERLQQVQTAHNPTHFTVFECHNDKWWKILARHRQILRQHVGRLDSILDVGCGYGRLLDIMPDSWCGDYVGIDISQGLLTKARVDYPHRTFLQKDIRFTSFRDKSFDLAILISVRGMVLREVGVQSWEEIEKEVKRVAERALVLEYHAADEGALL